MQQRRNLDLIRLLLLQLEGVEEVDLSGFAPEEVNYHKYLIVDAGLARGSAVMDPKFHIPLPVDLYLLTWEGQDFLANARNPKAWKSVMGQIANQGMDVSFGVLKSLLTAYVLKQVGP